ncbi:alginate lyase-domain-containing protein [Zychaea mexicana]|uniref:alginate lyase-domain-containing protein n=1 Tax=Zychaea mexicana TaxID=64656 RepID=UPI0022FDEDE7|nr:alginate lyase-domain-containing protein [Zychaea mexicana]KAI9499441.1 alginate lyase-domain-containing protein [Zychaea mexicana]
MNNLNPHLSDITVNLGYPPRRESSTKRTVAAATSYFSIKDKVLEPRRFFQYSSRKYRQRTRWGRFFLLGAGLFLFIFIFGYIPFFNFAKTASTLTTPTSAGTAVAAEPQRDQILLYRIIGNDLPPRHKEGQTLSNLHFILEHEPSFPNFRKIFLLNRISDPTSEAAVVRLLEKYGMEYIRVPFVEEEYKQLDFRLEHFPEPDFLHSDDYRRLSKVAKLRTLDYTYHDKNLYAMNNNGGRNTAIQHGRSISNARWIMPFDGNCYLSHNAFNEIKTQLDRHGADTKYFVVPMTRLLNNSVLLNNLDEKPKALEEPQIIFRYDATEEYNLNMRYGRRSKLELLWRLGAKEDRRLNRPTVAWEPIERPYSKDKGNFRTIGWVFRLFSGNQQQEENKKEASSIRAFNRLLAIQSSLDGLDEQIARRTFRQDRLFLYNETEMASIRQAYWSKDGHVATMMEELEKRAEVILEDTQKRLAPMSVTDDMDSVGPEELPSLFAKEDASAYLGPLSQNVTTLTLANYFLGAEKYGRWAANLVRVYFLNEFALEDQDEYSSARMIPDNTHLLDFLSDQGYSFPSLSRVPRVVPKYTTNRIVKASDLTKTDITALLDSMRLLRRTQMLTHKEYIELQASMAEVLEFLITSPTGIHLAQLTNHHGVLYDLQVTALAAFTDDVRLLLRVANRCRMRIGKQFMADGSQPYQDASVQTRLQSLSVPAGDAGALLLQYETLNLRYWTMLARGVQNTGVAKDIWHYTAKNFGRISHTVVAHLKNHATSSPYVKAQLAPLAHMARYAFLYSDVDPSRQDIISDRQWILDYASDFQPVDDNGTVAFLIQ